MKSQQILSMGIAGAMTMASANAVHAVEVAKEDFDGGAVNLISGFDPSTENIDDGPGDFFGVSPLGDAGVTATWVQGQPDPGAPFSVADDSVIDVSGGSRITDNAFAGDVEGIFGQARDVTDAFFALSDADDGDTAFDNASASWTFDINGFTDLALQIDMGQQSDGSSFGGISDTSITFTVQIDDGAEQVAFELTSVDASTSGFTFRAMDDGTVPTISGALQATGDNTVTKLLAEDGTTADNTFLNKSPASGDGAGLLDTFVTDINGTGSQLTLTMEGSIPFEAMAFDNITITGVPEPGSLALLGLGGLALLGRRRNK
jgi:hypothetical protein